MLSEKIRKLTSTGSAFWSTKMAKTTAISESWTILTSRSARRASRFCSWVRSQATRGMSGLSARCALLAARTSSVAVTVGSAIEEVSGLALGRVPARLERAEGLRARGVLPLLPPLPPPLLSLWLLPLPLLLPATVVPPRPLPAPYAGSAHRRGCTRMSGSGNRRGDLPDGDAARGAFHGVADDGGGGGAAAAECGHQRAGPTRFDGQEETAGGLGVGQEELFVVGEPGPVDIGVDEGVVALGASRHHPGGQEIAYAVDDRHPARVDAGRQP